MEFALELPIRAGGLLLIIALCHAFAQRLRLPDSFALTGAGVLFGIAYWALEHFEPRFTAATITPFLSPALPPEAYLWIFLPPILFQAAMEVDTKEFLADLAPIVVLAIGAVLAAAASVGIMAHLISGQSLTVCLLLGAIVSTTDPSTVIALFRRSGVPDRLIRLVEGESLFNDAAAIAISTLLIGALSVVPGSSDAIEHPLGHFLFSLAGGCALGSIVGALFVAVSRALHSAPFSAYTLSLALPNLIYPLAEHWLHMSGVAAVVCAGLMASRLLRSRWPASHLRLFQQLWEYQAALAAAAVFLLASAHVSGMLTQLDALDALTLCFALAAAVASRLAVLTLCVPLLSRIGICKPLPRAHRLLIAWGGVRGPVTLTLALCVARNAALADGPRQFAATMAAGFVLLNLVCNGLTLGKLTARLGIRRHERVVQADSLQ
ncbi:cation:proton antiporter [Paraburkholderia sp. LEh10]|uniref:cation:proton antiporter n=1 Tax=Paraburkholderia sp. LEh10 TaxID=2821353 RepID=UPI001AE96277|nr:cation:proton antiporter [Paraburkholderia sp. LEh10]MBP0595662.1 cation:proton antiporter [Paraburkholderia sp. LEh10]